MLGKPIIAAQFSSNPWTGAGPCNMNDDKLFWK